MAPKSLCPINPLTIPLFKGVLQKTKEILGTTNWTPYFGTSKRVYRANNIRAKLDETADTWIGACFFAKNVISASHFRNPWSEALHGAIIQQRGLPHTCL